MACAAMDMDYGYGLDYDPNNEDLLALFSNDEQPGIDFLVIACFSSLYL